jgi:CMP-N,N'-diacetyllegionaminic acid synthase
MHNGKTFLAIIPARGGSKRLPRKNILDLCGKPLIAWSIEACLNSKYLDKVVVSSDDDEILNISQTYGCDILKRPNELATDTSPNFEPLSHAINCFPNFDYFLMIQPTSPLRQSWHIDEAIEYLFAKKADAIISVCEAEHSPLWSNSLPDDLNMSEFLPEIATGKRSQDLPKFYRLNGAIHMCDTNIFLDTKTFFLKDKAYAYIMDKKYSVDIDDELDFKFAEVLQNEFLRNG